MTDEPEPVGRIDALLARVRDGDQSALAPLLEELYPVLTRRARRFTSSPDAPYTNPGELVDALLAGEPLFGFFAGTYRLDPDVLQSRTAFLDYCTRLFRRVAETRRRDNPFRHLEDDDEDDNAAGEVAIEDDDEQTPDQVAAKQEELTRLREAIEKLPQEQRVVLRLHDLEGQPMRVIAAALGVTGGRVASVLARARESLRQLLTSAPEPPPEPALDVALLHRLPLPLAQLYRRTYNAQNPIEAHNAAFYMFEVGLKMLGMTAVVEYANRPDPDPAIVERLKTMARPSLGHWWEFARLLLPVLAESDPGFAAVERFVFGGKRDDCPALAHLDAVLRERGGQDTSGRGSVAIHTLIDLLIGYRNAVFGHGLRQETEYKRMTFAFRVGFAELLARVDVLAGRRLVYVGPISDSVGGAQFPQWSLAGPVSERIANLVVLTQGAAELPGPERVYLTAADGTLRLLHPFASFDPETESCYLFNSRRGRVQIELLCYSTGRTRREEADDQRATVRRILDLPEADAAETPKADRPQPEPRSPSEPAHIYISYRLSDAFDVVDRLDDDLAREFGPTTVLRDVYRLTAGQEWASEFERRAKTCRVMLVVIGHAWQSSADTDGDWAGVPRLWNPEDRVRKEITAALDAGNVVIPVLVNAAGMPAREWLKNCGLERLADFQAFRLRTSDYDTDLAQLIEVLRAHLPEPAPPPPPPPAAHRRLYLSAGMREFRAARERLYAELRRPSLSVTGQEEFATSDKSTLEVIDDYIRHCDVVVHLVGLHAGALPPAQAVATLLTKYPDLPAKLPALGDKQSWNPGFTYTQWEAYLGLYHEKEVLVYRFDSVVIPDTGSGIPAEEQQAQEDHLTRLAWLRCPVNTLNSLDHLSRRILRDLGEATDPPAPTLTADEIVETFPTPIAAAYWWSEEVREDNYTREMAERALDRVVEVAMRYAALVAMADLIQCVYAANPQSPLLPPIVTAVLTIRGPHPPARWGEVLVACGRALRGHPDRFLDTLPALEGRTANHHQYPPLAEFLTWRQEFDRETAALTDNIDRWVADGKFQKEGGERVRALLAGLAFAFNYPLAFAAPPEPPRVTQLYSCLGPNVSTVEMTYPLFAADGFRPEVPFLLCRETNRVLYLSRLFVASAARESRTQGRVFLFQSVSDENGERIAEYESAARRELRSVRHRLGRTGLDWVWEVERQQRSMVPLTPEQVADLRHFPPTGELVGRTVGENFRLYAMIGAGTSGDVYAAESKSGERVAVKVTTAIHDHLRHEAELLAGLPPHPGLLRYYGHGTEATSDGELAWYAMEYAPGGMLEDRIRATTASRTEFGWADPPARQRTVAVFTAVADLAAHLHRNGVVHRGISPPNVLFMAEGSVRLSDFGLARRVNLDPTEALRIATDMARALEAIHRSPQVMHRDLKPSNVLLEPGGQGKVKVLDWGLVKTLSSGSTDHLHPPEYVPPEGVERLSDVSPRTDVYQLGLLLFEMAVGPRELFQSDARLPVNLNSVFPPLRGFLERCMAERPEDRPADAGEVLTQFRRDVLNVLDRPPVLRIEPTPEPDNPFAEDAPGATYYDVGSRLALVSRRLDEFDALWLYGPPGVGKTTLIRELLRRAADSGEFERVVYVDVAHPRIAVTDQTGILSRLHHAITDAEDLIPRLPDVAADLRERRMFLAFDSCDSLLSYGEVNEPGKTSDVLFSLLRACCEYDDANGVHRPVMSRFVIASREQPYRSKLAPAEMDYLLKWKEFGITMRPEEFAFHRADSYLDDRLATSPLRFSNKEKAGLIADANGSFDTLRRSAFELYERKRRERPAAVRWYTALALDPAGEVAVGQQVTATVRFLPPLVGGAHPPGVEPLDIPDGVLELTAFLDAPGFALSAGGHTATLPMDGRRPRQDALAFRLIAVGSGKAQVRVSVYPGGQSVGGVPVEVSAEVCVRGPLAAADIPLLPDVPSPRPDLTLGVWVSERPGGQRLVCRLHRPGHPAEPTTELPLTAADAAALRRAAALAGREAVALGGPDGTELLRRFGANLLHRLLPHDGPLFDQFQQAFNAAVVAPPRSLLVVSDSAAVLPWELLCVCWEQDGRPEYRFVGEVFAVAHWLDRRGLTLMAEVPVDEVELALPAADPVAGPVWADDLGGEVRVEHKLDELAVVRPGPCHGLHVLRDDPPRAGGEIAAASRATTDEPIVARRRLDFSLKRPVVGRSVTDRGGSADADTHTEAGWTWAFLSAGASAVVASRWPLPAGAEAVAARRVYAGLRAGEPLGEAVWAARRALRAACPEHPGWLAPSLFGHPLAAPYEVEPADGFTFLEALDPPADRLFRPGVGYPFRASYRAEAPAWYDGPRRVTDDDRLDGEEVTVAVLPMTDGPQVRERLRPGGGRVWFCDLTLTVPTEAEALVTDDDGKRTWPLVVRFTRGRKELHTSYLDLDVGGGP